MTHAGVPLESIAANCIDGVRARAVGGIVNQHVDGAEPGFNVVQQPPDRCGVRKIGLDGDGGSNQVS